MKQLQHFYRLLGLTFIMVSCSEKDSSNTTQSGMPMGAAASTNQLQGAASLNTLNAVLPPCNTLNDASKREIDVKQDFGAMGDGIADDTRAIQ